MASAFTHQFDTLVYKGTVTFPTQLFINGEFADPLKKGTVECASLPVQSANQPDQ
jgi:aldehyde dehydrogenase (NAD+)